MILWECKGEGDEGGYCVACVDELLFGSVEFQVVQVDVLDGDVAAGCGAVVEANLKFYVRDCFLDCHSCVSFLPLSAKKLFEDFGLCGDDGGFVQGGDFCAAAGDQDRDQFFSCCLYVGEGDFLFRVVDGDGHLGCAIGVEYHYEFFHVYSSFPEGMLRIFQPAGRVVPFFLPFCLYNRNLDKKSPGLF